MKKMTKEEPAFLHDKTDFNNKTGMELENAEMESESEDYMHDLWAPKLMIICY